MNKKTTIPTAALISILTVNCSHAVYIAKDLTGQLPPPIRGSQLITNQDIECVSDETARKIKLLEDRIVTLKGIIESTTQTTQ